MKSGFLVYRIFASPHRDEQGRDDVAFCETLQDAQALVVDRVSSAVGVPQEMRWSRQGETTVGLGGYYWWYIAPIPVVTTRAASGKDGAT